jgi:hypothetical protein
VDNYKLLTIIEIISKKVFTISIYIKPNYSLKNKTIEVWPKAFKKGLLAFTFINTFVSRLAFYLSPKMATSFKRTSWPLILIS